MLFVAEFFGGRTGIHIQLKQMVSCQVPLLPGYSFPSGSAQILGLLGQAQLKGAPACGSPRN